jgi:isocitrate dehydrogenase (NAD+)
MFEAIHGSAPRMLKEGRAQFANPSSMIKAGAMLLEHIGYTKLAQKLDKALSICGQYEKKLQITGRDNGVTGEEYGKYVLNTVRDKNIDEKYEKYAKETQ